MKPFFSLFKGLKRIKYHTQKITLMLKLNTDQEKVYQQIIDFIHSDQKYFLLTGSAGTGKTTLITRFLAHPTLEKYKVALTGCTNQAVSVLEKFFMKLYEKPESEELARPKEISCLTIHKLLKIKRRIDLRGKEIFHSNLGDENAKVKSKSIYYYNLIIVDEVSMLNQDLTLKLLEIRDRLKGKIVFVGDQAQLPPVNEKYSYIFQIAGNQIPHGHLSQVMRSDSLITKFTNSVRKLALEESQKLSFKKYGCERVVFYKKEKEWIDAYLDMSPSSTSIILSYTNREINRFNRLVRNKQFDYPKEIYIPGEKIVFLSHYNSPTDHTYFSSETAVIETIEETDIKLPNLFFYDFLNYNSNIKDFESKKEKDNLNELFDLIRRSQIAYQGKELKIHDPNDSSSEDSQDEDYISDSEEMINNQEALTTNNLKLEDFCQICYLDLEKKNVKGKVCLQNSKHRYCPMCYKNWIVALKMCPLCYLVVDKNGLITCPENDTFSKELVNFQKEFQKAEYKIWMMLLTNQGVIKVIHKSNEKEYQDGLARCRKCLQNMSQYLEKVKINGQFQDKKVFQANPRLKLFFQQLLQRMWDLLYYHYIDQFASISYGYAITTHRSQGSTYDNIFIFLKDIILNNRNQLEAYHCFYTASTRASKNLHILY